MTFTHHGYPVRDWTLADILVQDCSCGAPVYVLPEYGGAMGQVTLDALPLRTFRLAGHEEPYAMLEHGEPRFSEHVCPWADSNRCPSSERGLNVRNPERN